MNENQDEDENEDDDGDVLLILKWDGELTSMVRAQAEELGEAFRNYNENEINKNENEWELGWEWEQGRWWCVADSDVGGGELTSMGRAQVEELGEVFRYYYENEINKNENEWELGWEWEQGRWWCVADSEVGWGNDDYE